MVKSDFELSQPFIAENSKQRINFECVTNVSLWEPGSSFSIFKQALKNSPYHLSFKRCCNENLLKIVNPLSANPKKWSNTLKQFVGKSRRIV